jgi:hypothetical protein
MGRRFAVWQGAAAPTDGMTFARPGLILLSPARMTTNPEPTDHAEVLNTMADPATPQPHHVPAAERSLAETDHCPRSPGGRVSRIT